MPASSTICAIIPTYNRAALLREAIEAVLAQTRLVDEIIVVNDGSTDDTEATVKSYGTRITLISKPNGGKASALNLALTRCRSDYVWICDDDDLVEPDGVAPLAAALDADPGAGFAFGKSRFFRDGPAGRVYRNHAAWTLDEEPNINLQFLDGMFTHMNAMLVRRALYSRIGPFREDLIRCQDYNMVIRLSHKTKAIGVDKVIYSLRHHDGVRGAAADKFSARENTQKWLAYEQKVLAEVKKEYSLEEFTPTFARQWDAPLANRAALLQRIYIFSKRDMWTDAIYDFMQAGKLSDRPATPEELRFAENRLSTVLPRNADNTNSVDWVPKLRALYLSDRYTHDILDAACRQLLWHAWQRFKNGNIIDGVQTLRVLAGIVGLRGTFSRTLASLLH